MERVTRNVGRCLTETKLKDFDKQLEKFGEFVRVSQFTSPQPKHVSEYGGQLTGSAKLGIGTILYGVDQDGFLVWLGEIIDSSD
ncbi:MAG: hypothetical protein HC840_00435 [Leptolyngbyaceae cyanobacterium RM2_2_4]|nr:hypothetical protein [Leptolyngbyaceae cyanobacterium RM2_2_4]